MEIPIKMDDLGVPLFLETPILTSPPLAGKSAFSENHLFFFAESAGFLQPRNYSDAPLPACQSNQLHECLIQHPERWPIQE